MIDINIPRKFYNNKRLLNSRLISSPEEISYNVKKFNYLTELKIKNIIKKDDNSI